MWELIYLWSFKYSFMPDYLSGNSVEVDLADGEGWMKTRIDVQPGNQPWMSVGYKKLQLVWFSQMYTIVDVQVGRRACPAYNRKTRFSLYIRLNDMI